MQFISGRPEKDRMPNHWHLRLRTEITPLIKNTSANDLEFM
jgi:hypothetical protein